MVVPSQEDRQHQLPRNIQPVLENRYFAKDLEESTYADLCARIANAIAEAEGDERDQHYWATRFYRRLFNREFLPNTPTWINAGLDGKRTQSACYVLPLQDDMESILECSRLFGMVQKFGGGTGVDLTPLRYKGHPIRSTHGKACGPIAVLKYLGVTSQMITQGGAREGANMAVMSCYHKDVVDFITVKQRENENLLWAPLEFAELKVSKGDWTLERAQEFVDYCKSAAVFQLFNVSVAVDSEFMAAVNQYRAVQNGSEIPEEDYLFNQELACGLTIAQLWDKIVSMAWDSGDPGVLFVERAQDFARLHSKYVVFGTNPCGEQWLPAYGSCNLGSLNLAKFVRVRQPGEENLPWEELVNWTEFQNAIHDGVRFLDNVVSVNKHPDPKIQEVNEYERRIGLGIMGWADMLLKLDIPYASKRALKVCEKVAEFFGVKSHQTSYDLAKEKGAFPGFEDIRGRLPEGDAARGDVLLFDPDMPRRNATVTTVAPTGTISVVAGCSSGVEPHFAAALIHDGLKEYGGIGFMFASESILDVVGHFENPGEDTVEATEYFLRNEKDWLPANEIAVDYHILHQATWQKYIDNSISKTINLQNEATCADVEETFLSAYAHGTKGCTVFRDGCKPFQVLNLVKKEKAVLEAAQAAEEAHRTMYRPTPENRLDLPDKVPSERIRVRTAHGNMYVHVGYLNGGEPVELFVTYGNMGSEARGFVDGIAKLASEMLRSGIHPARVVKNLRGIKTEPFGMGPNKVLSAADGIGLALEGYMKDRFGAEWGAGHGWGGAAVPEDETPPAQSAPASRRGEVIPCPDCGGDIVRESGCATCRVCGYSKCG